MLIWLHALFEKKKRARASLLMFTFQIFSRLEKYVFPSVIYFNRVFFTYLQVHTWWYRKNVY